MTHRPYKALSVAVALACAAAVFPAHAAPAEEAKRPPAIIGEAFGKPVSEEAFDYYYKTALIFTRTGKQSRTDDETRSEAWQNLIFLREAEALKIVVLQEELMEELKRLLSEKGVTYGTDAYQVWVATQFGESAAMLESRIRDLLVINKLMKKQMDPAVTVTEAEMEEKYRNQYGSFESEYIWFENEAQAKEFQAAVTANPKLWKETFDAKRKELGQKGGAWINIMSLEALIDLWKFPREDAYRILDVANGSFTTAKNYYGDVVLRVLNTKKAAMNEYDEKRKTYYRDMLTAMKKRKIVQEYFDDLFKRAAVKDFVAEAKRAAKIEELKKKAVMAIETNQGTIEVKLFPDVAPFACENFVGLAEKGYYNNLTFHRVKKDFMIQGGDPAGNGSGGESIWKEPFRDEVSDKVVFDRPGLLAMANAGPDSNKSQFFITTAPATWLNGRHTIFGEVISGMDVVKKIEGVPVDGNDKPKEEQKMLKVYVKGVGNT